MNAATFPIVAIVSYLISAFLSARPSGNLGARQPSLLTLSFVFVALVTHGFALYAIVATDQGFNLGLFNAASLVALCIAFSVTLIMLQVPVGSLSVVVFPLAAVFVALATLFPSERLLPAIVSTTVQLHIALSIIAYSLFAIATLQAVYLAVADHKLKTHRPSLHFLPPLPTMETVLFQLTAIAFALLTISLVLGLAAIEDIKVQHLLHKIVFSILAWLVFATLIVGRWVFHWRGKRAVKYVCAGFVLLALAFFGTKVVLEVILDRV